MTGDEDASLREAARRLLERNTVGHGGFAFTAPSPPHYPDLWNWDSRFVAHVWAELEPARALSELEALFGGGGTEGSLPIRAVARPEAGRASLRQRAERIAVGWLQRRARLTQPPVPVVELLEAAGADPDRTRAILGAEARHLAWLRRERADQDGLVRIVHPWESGMDAKPSFDGVGGMDGRGRLRAAFSLNARLLRAGARDEWDAGRIAARGGFAVKDVLFNSLYCANLEATASLLRRTGDDEKAATFGAWASQARRSMLDKMFDDATGFFYDLGPRDERLPVKAVSGFAPLLLPQLPPGIAGRLVQDHLGNEREFWSNVPVPSVAMDEPSHDPHGSWPLWRGPSWINTNFLVWKGLRLHGFGAQATELARRTRAAVARSGFHEFYEPHTGEGLRTRTRGFAWSTLAAVMRAEPVAVAPGPAPGSAPAGG